jgi:hypothetical protein
MAKKKTGSLIGSWAFLIGVILAVILGFISMEPWMATVLVIIGIIVGLLNITSGEAMGFLTAAAILVIVTALSGSVFGLLGSWAVQIMDALMLVFVPATIIVALRAVFGLARS